MSGDSPRPIIEMVLFQVDLVNRHQLKYSPLMNQRSGRDYHSMDVASNDTANTPAQLHKIDLDNTISLLGKVYD